MKDWLGNVIVFGGIILSVLTWLVAALAVPAIIWYLVTH